MGIVRVGDDGKKIINKQARKTAAVAAIMAIAGVALYVVGDHLGGLFVVLCGNTMATIHNLADDS